MQCGWSSQQPRERGDRGPRCPSARCQIERAPPCDCCRGTTCVMNYCELIRAANPMLRLVALAARPLQRRRLCSRPGVWSLPPFKGAPEVLRLGDVLEVATAAANRHSSVRRPSSTSLLAQTLAGDTLETLDLILIANPRTSASLCIAVRISERWLQYASMTCKGEPGRKKMERCRLC